MDIMVRLSKPLPLASCGCGNAKTREGESPGSPPPQTHCGAPGRAARRAARVVQLRPELAGCPQDAPQAPPRCPPDASRMHPGHPQDASRMHPGHPQDASRMPPGCTPGAPRMLLGCLQDAPRMHHGRPHDAPRMLPGGLQDAPRRAERKRQPTGPPAEAAAPSRVPPQDRRGSPRLGAERRTRRRPGVAGKPCRPGDPAAAPRRGRPPARACPAYTSLPASRAPSLRHHPSSSLSSRPFAAGETPASVWRPARRAGASPGKSLPLPGGGGGGRAVEDSGEHENRAAAAARRAVASAPPAAANGTPPLPACPAHAARLPPGHVTRSLPPSSLCPPTSAPPLSLRREEGA
ncbi:unnamed protein product [Nyctereutes procyonoides]|uniref:(raccoon dog) hypothetical protein n=1 Tax=Nyctereutes procyonoides TaxID=34880 RepID=A0A811YRP9_NYCPR|nr:unnamed protein product [Nyctereutes procyonoides]CAD7688145.1 unnamed protein product [Nyctereutes procyonoides]